MSTHQEKYTTGKLTQQQPTERQHTMTFYDLSCLPQLWLGTRQGHLQTRNTLTHKATYAAPTHGPKNGAPNNSPVWMRRAAGEAGAELAAGPEE